ncbi:fungal specific transcription factor domain-containing protein [Arthroderma uncinatum]|uniref:fungal specific transcription factor domain-containing protein n=1 Tax=Arthroderma uncinatum TaxID=74035 RepID=UPI00144ABD01|nr:fungal specific transcription factor domain-containing protein [Arthroderma uncinatum]KAF3483551.1 fungal specific transcription factor domain-containing protein [Arthroderma uncinatum]
MLSVSDHERTTTAPVSQFPDPIPSHPGPPGIPVSASPYHQPQDYSYFTTTAAHPQTIATTSDNIAEGCTLDEILGHTAHFMGLSGEQDMNLLSSFRSDILNETNYVDVNFCRVEPGNSSQGLPPVHFSVVRDCFPERDHRAKLLASNGIEEIVGDRADRLVRLYFEYVHPAFPILSKGRFLREYMQDKYRIPASLRGAVYGLASSFIAQDDTLRETQPINQAALFEHVHSSLNRELESPKIATLQACLLVLHEQPAENGTTESPKVWAFSGQAVSCAHVLGLHRDPTFWDIPEWEKRLRRKLWWATFYTDRWTSICHGNPPHIHNDSFDTRDIEIEDLMSDEDVGGHAYSMVVQEGDRPYAISLAVRFIERIKLTKMLDNVLGCSFTLAGYSESIKGHIPKEQSLLRCQAALQNWMSLLPQCLGLSFSPQGVEHCVNASLHLSFYATETLLFRALMTPATVHSKTTPSSSLRRHFDGALACFRSFVRFVETIQQDTLQSFWGRHARSNFILCTNFLIYLFLCAFTPDRVTAAYEMLETFHRTIKHLSTLTDERNIGLLRPAVLRIDSFFGQAVEIMRAQAEIVSPSTGVGVLGEQRWAV